MDLPFNYEAEKQVLSNMIFSSDVLVSTLARLTEEDFYLEKHQIIFASIRQLFEKRKVHVEVNTLIDDLLVSGNLDKIGGPEYILELADAYNDESNADYYITSVEEKSTLRKLITLSDKIVTKWQAESSNDIESYINKVEKDVISITRRRKIEDFITTKGAMDLYRERVLKAKTSQAETSELKTGYSLFDNVMQGFRPGEVYILAARPSVGKTALALNFLTGVAAHTRKPCVFFSLEMGIDRVTDRILSSLSGVPMKKIQRMKYDKDEEVKLDRAMRSLEEWNLFFDQTPAIKAASIRAKLNNLSTRFDGDMGLVVVDYIGLITPDVKSKKDSTRSLELGEISASLKAIARDFKCPILVLSQLNRGVEQRVDKTPGLSDLRESGAIEQDADVVMFIHRPDYGKQQEAKTGEETDDDESDSAVSLIVAKNRNGELCTLDFMFQKHIGKFVQIDKTR